MLKVQNSLPVANQVKFKQNQYLNNDIDRERDQKLDDINGVRDEFDSLAQTLDANPDKVSKKASKLVRLGASVLGLVATFVTAKYGSKVAINTFKNFANSKMAKRVTAKIKDFKVPLNNAINKVKDSKVLESVKNSKVLTSVNNSKAFVTVKEFMQGEKAQKVFKFVNEQFDKTKTAVKSINAQKVQTVFENTMGASAATSVLIDDLAGRNADKSNVAVALGASGGDR